MNKINKKIQSKCKDIRLVLTDVDGVLTDGGRYYSEKGESMKKFHTRDGMGINILLRNNVQTAILTKEKSKIVKKWSNEMNVSELFWGAINKEKELEKIIKKYKINYSQVAFIGDDVNDIETLKKVGFSSCPNDAISSVKSSVDYVCQLNGGNGCFRELADLILSVKFPHKTKWY